MAQGSWIVEKLDKVLVCSETWSASSVQEPQGEGEGLLIQVCFLAISTVIKSSKYGTFSTYYCRVYSVFYFGIRNFFGWSEI